MDNEKIMSFPPESTDKVERLLDTLGKIEADVEKYERGDFSDFAFGIPVEGKPKKNGAPNGTRTRVAALKGRSPRPLDDGDTKA